MTLLKADTQTAAWICLFQPLSRTEGERIWKPTKTKTGERKTSLSHSLLHLLREERRWAEAGALLLKESCHFDSRHHGNGCTVPQSSALCDGGLGPGCLCTALLYLCKPALNGQTLRPGAIATAAGEREIPMATRRQIQLCLLFMGKRGKILQLKPAEIALFGSVCVCVCVVSPHDKDVFLKSHDA